MATTRRDRVIVSRNRREIDYLAKQLGGEHIEDAGGCARVVILRKFASNREMRESGLDYWDATAAVDELIPVVPRHEDADSREIVPSDFSGPDYPQRPPLRWIHKERRA